MKKVFLGLLSAAVLLVGGYAYAQSTGGNGSSDPCSVYPKQSVFVNQTATMNAVPGVAGKAIYVCSVTTSGLIGGTTAATPSLQLFYGQLWSATPCGTATATVPFQVGSFGGGAGQGNVTTYGTNGGTLIEVPISAASPVTNLCAWQTGLGTTSFGSIITYVQINP